MLTQIETKSKVKDYSMGLLFLIEYLKEEFNVEVSDEELLPENFESVNSIIKFIEGKL